MFEKLVLDLSHWNNSVDFRELKRSGVWGVVLKLGGAENGKFYKDKCFDKYYKSAKENGLHVGCYWFTGMKFSAFTESVKFRDYIREYQFDLPIYLDFECSTPDRKWENTQFCIDFIQNMYDLGKYFVGIYASDISGFKDRLEMSQLTDFTWWVARYGNPIEYARQNAHMWQFTSKGRVVGIKGNVDTNYCYRDFPTVIISGHYNGY